MPRRQRGEGALFRRESDGLWVGRIELGWIDGVRRRRTVYGRTMAEAQAKMRTAREAAAAGNLATRGTPLAAWLTYWLAEVVPGKRKMTPRTVATYESYCHNYLMPCLGKVHLDKLAARHVRDLQNYVTGRKGLSPTTASHAQAVLSTALNDAIREGLLTSNPCELVDHPSAGQGNVRRPLTMTEVRRLLDVVERPTATRWLTALMLGLRQGECLGLRWSRVDLTANTITVDTQLQRIPWQHGCPTVQGRCGRSPEGCRKRTLRTLPGYGYTVVKGNLCLVTTKTESSKRVVPVPEILHRALVDHWYQSPTGPPSPDQLVWRAADGGPIEPTEDRREWHELLRLAGIEDTDQHSARHTAATLLLALGVGEDVRQAILGHSTAAARKIYSHVDIEVARRAVAALEDAITDNTRQQPTTTERGD